MIKATAESVLIKWMVFKVYEGVNDKLFEKCEADPENEELEVQSQDAYERMWESLDKFAAELENFTDGQVDVKTARRMVTCPKYRGRLEDLMKRIAA